MRGFIRLIEGLLNNDPAAWAVLGFTVVGTTAIVLVTEIIQRRRKRSREARQQTNAHGGAGSDPTGERRG